MTFAVVAILVPGVKYRPAISMALLELICCVALVAPTHVCCRRQALDFFFTYFHLNYEESLIPPGTTIQELAAVAPGPKNAQGKVIWNMQAYALDPAGDLPSLQRLCNAFGCADLSPGQVPVYIGGYQLQVQQPFTAVG